MIYSEETPIFAVIKVRNEAHGGLVWPETVDLNLESITNISYSNDFFGERGFVRILFPFFLNPQNANPSSARCNFSPLYTIILYSLKHNL